MSIWADSDGMRSQAIPYAPSSLGSGFMSGGNRRVYKPGIPGWMESKGLGNFNRFIGKRFALILMLVVSVGNRTLLRLASPSKIKGRLESKDGAV